MDPQEINQLIAELQRCYARTQGQAAFLDLKQSELRPGDQISLWGFMETKEQLAMQQSVLWGQAHLARQIIAKNKIQVDVKTATILKEIFVYADNGRLTGK